MNSILSTIALLVLLQGAQAFAPRPSASRRVAPWGIAVIRWDQTAAAHKKHPLIFQTVIESQVVRSIALRAAAAGASGAADAERHGPTRIIIAGAPASGKGTQCERIKEKFGVVHLSTGDMLRAAVSAGTDVGKEAKAYMDSGNLVPDSTIIGVVRRLATAVRPIAVCAFVPVLVAYAGIFRSLSFRR